MQEQQALPSSGLMMREYRSMDLVATDVVGVPLAAGNYRVVATNTTSLCSSSVTLFTVNDVSVTPVITQNTITNNTNCTGATSNGSITIDVDGGVPAATDFTIQWYTWHRNSSPIVGATTATLSNLAAGDYTVEVTDILSPGNTCSSIATFTIVDDLPVFTINTASITVGRSDGLCGERISRDYRYFN